MMKNLLSDLLFSLYPLAVRRFVAVACPLCVALLLLGGCQTATVAPEDTGGPAAAPTGTDLSDLPPGAMDGRITIDEPTSVGVASLLTPPGVTPVTVGVLLPLTGRGSDVGRALLDAALLALHDMGEDRLVLLPRDTAGTPEGARAAAADVLQQGAELILGPLLREGVAAAAPLARERNVNMIAFSSDRSVAGDGVFLISFMPEQEVDRVVGYASTQGIRRFAALIPESRYGYTVAAALEQVVGRVGGEMVGVEYYAPDGANAEGAVRRLAQYGGRDLEAEEADRPPLPYDAVLLPEGGTVLRMVAPLLPYYDIDPDQIRVLGTGLWAEPDLGHEQALVGGWYAGPPPESAGAFADRFQQVYGRRPPRLASMGYDAAALAAALASGSGAPAYDRGSLTNPSGFAGIDGIFRFQESGVAQRGLAVIEVRRDGAALIAPAPQSFEEFTQ